jgi:hypothetical protein
MLVFTNTSGRVCTMYGYPGVSFVTGAGGQVGDAARRNGGVPVVLVTVPVDGSAHARVRLTQSGNYDAGVCRPVAVAGLRVFPPDETAALFVAVPRQACSAAGVAVPEVLAVEPGASGT